MDFFDGFPLRSFVIFEFFVFISARLILIYFVVAAEVNEPMELMHYV